MISAITLFLSTDAENPLEKAYVEISSEFSMTNLSFMRRFYLAYPKFQTMSEKLSCHITASFSLSLMITNASFIRRNALLQNGL